MAHPLQTPPARPTPATRHAPGDPALAARLRAAVEGEVRFDALTRGIYATDASHYQIEPLGVVFPASVADVEAVLEVAREDGAPVLPRGAGTSQAGQTVGRAIVVDASRRLRAIGEVSRDGATVEVEPGVVLDHLNRALAHRGLWFPVDPSTGSRATLGGMAGNNSAGARSLRYGMMADNVEAAEILLADGRRVWVGEGHDAAALLPRETAALRALHARLAGELEARRPRTLRDVAGYRLDHLAPGRENLARLLVGSEGTLAFFTRLRLRLSPLPRARALGVCHFSGLFDALDSVRQIVELGPSAVELVDHEVLRLAAARPDFRGAMEAFVRGEPGALLLVEFSSEDPAWDPEPDLDRLEALLGDVGSAGAVVRARDARLQAAVWEVRRAGLNVVMSMAGPRKPVSFIEDCAVPLDRLAEYARRVDAIFRRHGTGGTWYAHASVGCLHVRPALNLKDPDDVGRMRAIAEETHEVVRAFGGTHSGEHGDGILRSEFLESMLGPRMVEAFREVKAAFDPAGLMNPGKIVDPPRMDDRSLFRYPPGYPADGPPTDLTGAPGEVEANRTARGAPEDPGLAGRRLPVVLARPEPGGLLAAVEACNNNGACRKSDPGVMCPSYRVTLDERHSTRGRANALRLALTGQLGEGDLDSPELAEAMALCVSCKGCRRECPTGVDMARLKLAWQHGRNGIQGVPARERLLAAVPRVAPLASPFGRAIDAAGRSRPLRRLARRTLGLSERRALPRWSPDPWRDDEMDRRTKEGAPDAVLFVDTFTRWFEPEIARAARDVLAAGGWDVTAPPSGGARPLCCGRTYLSAGMLDEARREARRLVDALGSLALDGAALVGIEPSCLFTLKDELPALVPGPGARAVAERALLLEELLAAGEAGDRIPFRKDGGGRALVHGHCHQKAFGATGATLRALALVPGLEAREIASGCCGMAGAFGYHAEHHDTSLAMAELELLPAVRAAPSSTRIVADGTSCRAQIRDATGREAVHAAMVLRGALAGG